MLIELRAVLDGEAAQSPSQAAVTGPGVKKPRGAQGRANKEIRPCKDPGPSWQQQNPEILQQLKHRPQNITGSFPAAQSLSQANTELPVMDTTSTLGHPCTPRPYSPNIPRMQGSGWKSIPVSKREA